MAREHIHLIGIGGTGMTALAGLLDAAGCRVTGSDRALYPPTSTILAELGLAVETGFDPARLDPAPDLVVVGNAISRGNPELETTLDRDLEYASMPQVLHRRFLRHRHSISVMGTHGKTTTASMTAWILADAGVSPGWLIGGLPHDLGRPFSIGDGPAFVVEGDEYDSAFFDKGPKFMHYRPDTALLGTVEFDHADIYRDLREVTKVFRRVPHLVPARGLIVRHEDCALTREVTEPAWSRVEGYGFERGRWRAVDFAEDAEGSTFRILRDGNDFAGIRLPVGGEHNALNALAAAAACHEQGVAAATIARALGRFQGVRRRLEVRGEEAGVLVIDDFAHHPTAIAATLTSLGRRYPGRRLWAVLEPRSWSLRRNVFQERLPEALAGAGRVVVADVYNAAAIPESDRLDPDRLVADLAARGTDARFLPGAAEIAEHVAGEARPGDVVAILSNGGFDGLHDRLLDGLRRRAAERREHA